MHANYNISLFNVNLYLSKERKRKSVETKEICLSVTDFLVILHTLGGSSDSLSTAKAAFSTAKHSKKEFEKYKIPKLNKN